MYADRGREGDSLRDARAPSMMGVRSLIEIHAWTRIVKADHMLNLAADHGDRGRNRLSVSTLRAREKARSLYNPHGESTLRSHSMIESSLPRHQL